MADVPDERALDFHLFADGRYVRTDRVDSGDPRRVVALGYGHTSELRALAHRSFAVVILDPMGDVVPTVIAGKVEGEVMAATLYASQAVGDPSFNVYQDVADEIRHEWADNRIPGEIPDDWPTRAELEGDG